MSIVRTPLIAGTYSSFITSPYRFRSADFGTRSESNLTHALSRSLPVVLRPMSPTVIPGISSSVELFLMSIKNACGPHRLFPTVRSATHTAFSAHRPCEIQFLAAPSDGELMMKHWVDASHVAVVSTTKPELTPASRSVSPKHPSCPASWMASSCLRCAGPPRATTVPAKRLNCTVNLIQNPGPCSGACVANSRCARKKRSGRSLMSVNRRMPDFVSARRNAALSS
mmetsp:Transcript_11669/g.54351  ORF Transcript_11669/g.54351 Transcript_11669/m.54351 type:complete len:226 (-) Transcript_11669:149-826(-)